MGCGARAIGEQAASLRKIIESHKAGELDKDSALATILASFPFNRQQTEAILGNEYLPPAELEAIARDGADHGSVGVIVLKDGEVLTGRRADNHLIGGPGGHIETGETPEQAAVRETIEEFGIKPTALKYLGQLDSLEARYGKPHIFLCTNFVKVRQKTDGEMSGAAWTKPGNLVRDCFPPFQAALELLAGR
jgi:mutator protein MutT